MHPTEPDDFDVPTFRQPRVPMPITLNGRTREDLENLKAAVIASRPELKDFLENSDPEKSPMLRGLMLEHIKSERRTP